LPDVNPPLVLLLLLLQELDAAGLLASPQSPTPPRFEWQTLGKLPYLQVNGPVDFQVNRIE
jgi:hypothetical protein